MKDHLLNRNLLNDESQQANEIDSLIKRVDRYWIDGYVLLLNGKFHSGKQDFKKMKKDCMTFKILNPRDTVEMLQGKYELDSTLNYTGNYIGENQVLVL